MSSRAIATLDGEQIKRELSDLRGSLGWHIFVFRTLAPLILQVRRRLLYDPELGIEHRHCVTQLKTYRKMLTEVYECPEQELPSEIRVLFE